MQLTLNSRFAGNIYIIQCAGRIVLGPEAMALEAALNQAAELTFNRFVLSLAEVDRLDSIGMGLVVRFAERLRRRGGDIRLAAPPPFLAKLLDITHLSNAILSFPTEDDAILSYLRQPAPQDAPASTGPRVLFVDESADLCVFVRTVLGQYGFDTVLAGDGEQALRRLGHQPVDLVLLDVLMPGHDGFEVCRLIRAQPRWADIPIIFLSAADDKDLIVRALEAGGVDYVTKPVIPDELLPRIQRHLATAQSVRSARTALDLTGRFLIAVDSAGRTVWSTPQATRLLREVFNDDAAGAFTVPPELAACLSPPPTGMLQAQK